MDVWTPRVWDVMGRLSPAEYEELVHDLVDGLGVAFGDGALRGGKANRLCGASGYRHQIDVSIHLPEKIILIECKRFNRPVAVHHALTLAARLQEIREANPSCMVTASLVSTQAVTAGSLKIAKHSEFSIDQVTSLAEYAITILRTHYVGVASWLRIVDAPEAEVLTASTLPKQDTSPDSV